MANPETDFAHVVGPTRVVTLSMEELVTTSKNNLRGIHLGIWVINSLTL